MLSNILPYGRQMIEDDDIEAVVEVLKGDYLTTGPAVAAFEKELASVTGAKEAVVVGNGTHALHLACLAANLQKGDWAIVPSLTFLATANAVRYCGANVLFADVDPDTGLLTPETLQAAIDTAKKDNLNIRAVLPVHLTGQMVDQKPIQKIASRHNLTIISDSCHALGSYYQETPAGSAIYEDMACFSFHPVKTVAMGEGGAITTNDKDKANKMRLLRSHGMTPNPDAGIWAYDMKDLGYNYRASDMQCALGLSQLKKLDRFVAKRQALSRKYDDMLIDIDGIDAPFRQTNQVAAWHLYAARFDFEKIGKTRSEIMTLLKEKGIGSQVHYIPVHTQPYYKGLYGQKTFQGAEYYYKNTLSLPLFPSMEKRDVERVVRALADVINN